MIAGRYSLDREIGRGGMGAVWLGHDVTLDRAVALKRIGVIPGGRAPDVRRAEREARLAATLNHPHVVAVFDLVEDSGQQWLVMEYVEGRSLSQIVRENGPLDPAMTASVLAQIADALAAAHSVGIVHRDVKPSNILVTNDGTAKLSDFGIARSDVDDSTLTQTGLVSGSPAYLAPEVASGAPATAASDAWSLGATAYHALAGHPPYSVGENVMAVLYQIVHESPPRPEESGWLGELLDHTMTPVPEQRWSMARVSRFLRQGPGPTGGTRAHTTRARGTRAQGAVASEPAHEPTATGLEPVAGRSSVRRWALTTAAVLLIGIVAVTAFVIGNAGGDRGTTAPPPQTPTSVTPSVGPTETGMQDFIRGYLATVTSDRAAAWEMLTPEFQKASGDYERFWSTVRSARVDNIRADTTSMTVSYDVAYVMTDGSTRSETIGLRLTYEDGKFLIAGES